MHRRREAPPSLAGIADEQAGVVTRSQAQDCNLSRHVIERLRGAGSWQVLAPGVYFTMRSDVPWLARAWAGVLVGGSDSALAGESAAVLHGLIDRRPLPIHVLIPHNRRLVDRPWLRFHRQREGARMPYAAVQPTRTRMEDTVLDLCSVGDPADVITWITKAVQRRLTSPVRLLMALRWEVVHNPCAVGKFRPRSPGPNFPQVALAAAATAPGVH